MPDAAVFRIEIRNNRVAVLWMNDPDSAVNTLRREWVEQLDSVLTEIEARADLKVLVFASEKTDNFIAGANLDMLKGVETADEARTLSRIAQRLNDRLTRLRPRSVAAIHGACLGGGLELALALDARVASHDPKTRIGLPEVRLGLLPGGGGTQRLPALIGSEKALDLLLTGRELNAWRAHRLGIVDDVVPREILIDAAIKLGELRQRDARRHTGFSSLLENLRAWATAGNPLGRRLLFSQARKRTLRMTRGNYPAPLRILEVVRAGLEKGVKAGLAAEAEAFGELVVSPQAAQLIHLFFASNALKKDSGTADSTATVRAVRKLGVLGAGLMGAGIGYVTVTRAKTPVRLKDKDDSGLTQGLAYMNRLLDERVNKHAMTPLEREQTAARFSGTIDYSGFANTDMVIEAVFEHLPLKQRMVREIEAITGEHTVFASNTSAIPIKDIATASGRPETIIGMHYFSPVEKMPLLEVIATEFTAPWVVASCVEFGKRQGKTVIVVRDGPGFYTSRALGPYMNEAVHLLTEGVAIERIDAAIRNLGFPVGPMRLLDEVGIDVGEKVAATLCDAFGERMRPPQGIGKLLQDNRMGRKNQRGLYAYGGGKRARKSADKAVYALLGVEAVNPMPDREIAERCVLQLINEAVHCLGEGVLRSPRDGDIGAVFGLGFPPFLGGPFRYLDQQGAAEIVARLEGYCDRFGERFAPAPLLRENSTGGKRFYSV